MAPPTLGHHTSDFMPSTLCIALAAVVIATSPAVKSESAAIGTVKNIVLVHGANTDGSGWRGVYDILTRDGFHVSVVQQPLTGVADDVAATKRVIDQLDALIGDTLQLSRLSEAEPTFARETLELGHLVTEVVEDAYFEASAEGKSIRPEKISGLSAVGNFELLRRAIDNVIRNAIRFAPVGTTVEVSARVDNGVPIVAVRDHGPGVPERDLNRIFEAFYRVAEARERATGGVGLGLAITARIMALHGGSARAKNATDGGLIVELFFPMAEITPPVRAA